MRGSGVRFSSVALNEISKKGYVVMTINRRRAPSKKISSEKKLAGHKKEVVFADIIGGEVIKGTQKADVEGKNGQLYSIKSGKKWQVFLYGYDRISNSAYLNILKPCLDCFPTDYNRYKQDREICIAFKEEHVKNFGKDVTKNLKNESIIQAIGSNAYITSKTKLSKETKSISQILQNKKVLRNFLGEAFFNNNEVDLLSIFDTTYNCDERFKIFSKDDVLDTFTKYLTPSISKAGRVPEDYNVEGQKVLLRYRKNDGKIKNIVEIEIRNDSSTHYRQVRFNMYSKDALYLLLFNVNNSSYKSYNDIIYTYDKAISMIDF